MMDLDIPERLIPIRGKIDKFVREKVDPLTQEYYDEINVGDRWSFTDRQNEIMDGLKDEAREAGLWNFFLPASQGGAGVSNLEYALLAEVMARNPIHRMTDQDVDDIGELGHISSYLPVSPQVIKKNCTFDINRRGGMSTP